MGSVQLLSYSSRLYACSEVRLELRDPCRASTFRYILLVYSAQAFWSKRAPLANASLLPNILLLVIMLRRILLGLCRFCIRLRVGCSGQSLGVVHACRRD